MKVDEKSSEPDLSWKVLFVRSLTFIKDTPITWVFGVCFSLPLLVLMLFESLSLQADAEGFQTIALQALLLLLLCALLFFAGEAGFILTLKKTSSSVIEYIAATGALIRWYFLCLLVLLGFFAFFFAPLSFAPESARPSIQGISTAFFLFIASITFILKMFGSFYLLLGKISLGNALRASATLFMEHVLPSSFLFIATIIFSLAAGMIVDTLYSRLSFPLSEKISGNIPLIALILSLSSFLNIFFRAFWYFFFETIAAEKPRDWQKEAKMIEKSMVPAEDEA